MATVLLRNVSSAVSDRKVHERAAVNDVTAQIRDGEFAVVTGPRASGKSTFLRLIAGLDPIVQGEILIGDRNVNDLAPKDREVTMVFREDALYPRMSVNENIGFGLKLRRFPVMEIKKRVQEATAILGIENLLALKPAALSAEQGVRVAIARSMVRQPKVFLFEEPFAHLDLSLQADLRTEITKLHQRLEATVIYSTRDSNEAMSLADRILVLHDGILQQSDSSSAVYAAPANLFVAGAIGTPPMNLIYGTLKQEREAFLFREAGDGTIELRLPPDHAGAAASAGKSVVLGFRAEDIAVALSPSSSQKAEPAFPALVEVVEAAGASTILHLQTGAHSLFCRTPGVIDRHDAGRRMRFTIDAAKAHLFDPDSTRRIG